MPRTTDAPGGADLAAIEERWWGVHTTVETIHGEAVWTYGPQHRRAGEDIWALLDEVRRLRAELAEARPVVAAARDWCHTYAVRDLTPEESALMTAVAAREDALAARDGGGEAAAPPG